jgi:hypothetical protein
VKEIANDSEEFKKYIEDKKISLALMASFVILIIQYFILIYFNLIDSGTGSRIQLISKGLVGVAFLYAFPSVLKRSGIKAIGIYGFSIFIFLIHFTIFPENRTYMTNLIFPFFFMSLPAFIYTLSIKDLRVFKTIMKKLGYIVFIFGLLIGMLVFLGRTSVGAYSMSLSYYMLLPTILFLDELLDKFSLKTLVLVGISLLIILALGSRGAILCVIVFIILKFIRPNSKRTYKRALGHFSIICVGVVALVFMEQILMSIYNFLMRFGINSRSLILFTRENIYLTGRDRIYENVLSEILENPILGIGIAGDTRIIGNSYVHNFFIEVVGNFGVVLGSILSITVLLLIIKSLLTKDTLKYNLFIIWLSLGFVHLMVSSSYLTDLKFWIFLGLVINFNKAVAKRKYTKSIDVVDNINVIEGRN